MSTANPDLLKQASGILGATARYISDVQPRLDAFEARNRKFAKQASETVKVLVGRGILDQRDAKKAEEKFVSDPCSVFDFVSTLARRIGPEAMGKQAGADVQRNASVSKDPWSELMVGNDENANTAMLQ